MRKLCNSLFVCMFVILMTTETLYAIAYVYDYYDSVAGNVVYTTKWHAQEEEPALESSGNYDIDWNVVYYVGDGSTGGTGVGIAPRWILTAKHVSAYLPNPGQYAFAWNPAWDHVVVRKIQHPTEDLALVELNKDLPEGYVPYARDINKINPGLNVVHIGPGISANLWLDVTPDPVDPDNDEYFLYYLQNTFGWAMRWGTNQVDDAFGNKTIYTTVDTESINSTILATPYETGVTTGDSGSGVFAKIDGRWKLIAIPVAVNYKPLPNGGTGIKESWSKSAAYFSDWIGTYVPDEPVMEVAGDFDFNGVIDILDLQSFARQWAWTGIPGDIIQDVEPQPNGDGKVDFLDFVLFARNYDYPQMFYEMTLDTDPGWTTEGLWAYGQPTGDGGSSGEPDPTEGFTGDNVYGYNLTGDYESILSPTHLTSGAIDCTGRFGTHLKFQRWLGVELDWDHAYVQVSNNGTDWTKIWGNNSQFFTDTSWNQVDLNISHIADNQPIVYLRWTMSAAAGNGSYCGWNIDDIQLWGTP